MADLVITAASVAPGAGARLATGTAGATITAGQSVYIDSSNLVQKTNAATSAILAAAAGIALNNAASGQPVTYQTAGNITIGATLTTGAVYIVSGASAGGIAPVGDLTSGWFTNIELVAISTTVATIIIQGGNPLTAHS